MSTLSELLNSGTVTARQAAAKASKKGIKLPYGTIAAYWSGSHGRPSAATLSKLAQVVPFSEKQLQEAAWNTTAPLGPYTPPEEAALLDHRQRRALDELIRSIAIPRIGADNDMETDEEPRTPRKATTRKKTGEVSTVQRDTDRSAGRRLDIVRPDESAREPKIRARAIRIEIDGSVHAEPEDIPVSASTLEEALQELLDRYTDQGFVVDTDDGVADTGADVFVHGERFDMVIELKDSDSQFRPSADLVEVAMRYVMNARNRDVQAASDAGARQSNYELANRRGGGTSEGRRRREEQDRDAERGEE
ncbi:hypothetical protein NWF34_09880 [Gordonia sp. GONU]|uniref:hypothetical protein n=1 Tax=Gordonia sp. GONU TaxID=2972949 RepID=UPI0021ABEC88|nr:hypothetical protein [Gordonia sp. GONU]MCR8897256.1 hypothetical protein [Gordonia sp. GONU]